MARRTASSNLASSSPAPNRSASVLALITRGTPTMSPSLLITLIFSTCLSGKELLRCMGEVFDVYSDSSRFQNCLDCGHHFFSGLTESSDDVHRERDREDPRDSFDSRHEFITTNNLAIRVAERYHESCARGCDR